MRGIPLCTSYSEPYSSALGAYAFSPTASGFNSRSQLLIEAPWRFGFRVKSVPGTIGECTRKNPATGRRLGCSSCTVATRLDEIHSVVRVQVG